MGHATVDRGLSTGEQPTTPVPMSPVLAALPSVGARWLLTVVAWAALLLSGCATPDPTPATDLGDVKPKGVSGTEPVVELLEFDFAAPRTLAVGERIVVVNSGELPHTFTAKDRSFDSGTVEASEQTTLTIDRPGVYDYLCVIHPDQMVGRMEVTG